MNQNPSDDSANVQSSGRSVVASTADIDRGNGPDRSLNPLIQQALSSLDIKLEDELNRFRTHQADPNAAVATVAPVEVVWEQSADLDDSEILTAEIVKSAISYPQIHQDANSQQPKSSAGFAIVDGLASFTTADGRPASINYGQLATRSQREDGDREHLNLNFSSGGQIAPVAAEEYSSASQELLRQIQAGYRTPEPAQSKSTPAKPKRLFTPLKIGSAAAVCAIAGGATYAYFNPSVLAPLTTKTVTPLVATTTSSLGAAIESPNLAANEFTDLTLSRINTIKLPAATNASTAPTATIATPTGVATAPMAVPYNPMTSTVVTPTAAITSQPQLADSLVRALLPANYHPGIRPIAPAAPKPAIKPAAKSSTKS